MINRNCAQLLLPKSWGIHNWFSVNLFRPYKDDPFTDRHKPVPLPEEVEGHLHFEVERILDSKIVEHPKPHIEYHLRFKGFDESDDLWLPSENLNCPRKIARFHKEYPSKPRKPPKI